MVRRLGFLPLLVGVLSVTPGSMAFAQRPAGDAASFAAYVATGYRVTPNVTYMTASGVELKLDFYRPAQASGPLPTAIFMHGGGYRVSRARKQAAALNVMPYVQMGWNAVNVEYRAERRRACAGGRRGRTLRAALGDSQREGIQRRHRAHRRDRPVGRIAPRAR